MGGLPGGGVVANNIGGALSAGAAGALGVGRALWNQYGAPIYAQHIGRPAAQRIERAANNAAAKVARKLGLAPKNNAMPRIRSGRRLSSRVARAARRGRKRAKRTKAVVKDPVGRKMSTGARRLRGRKGKGLTLKSLASRVKKLAKAAGKGTGVKTYRRRLTGQILTSGKNVSITGQIVLNNLSDVNTQASALRYFDPATPGTLIVSDVGSASYSQKLDMKCSAKIIFKNSYQTPVMIRVAAMRPKTDTAVSPSSAFSDGLVDVGGNADTSMLVYWSDSALLKSLYKSDGEKTATLVCGESIELNVNVGHWTFDPSVGDSQVYQYQKKLKACVLLVRLEGVIAHDSGTSANVGSMQGGVDYHANITWTTKYEAGVDIHFYDINDQSATMGSTALTGTNPVTDLQGFSTL